MTSDLGANNLSPEKVEAALQFFRQRLQENINFLKDLTPVYYTMAQAANQLNSNAFAHRGEVDDAVDRTVAVGHLLDKIIKQTQFLLAEYQAVLIVDQAAFAVQLKKDEF
ncbi:MAG: hypothetical protein M0021_12030 [Clostridia bacterium]|nr:hypothetical protein [Bacillota bacterium]MDA8212587.1 hypothetical protein [Clostridia bacterium]